MHRRNGLKRLLSMGYMAGEGAEMDPEGCFFWYVLVLEKAIDA